MRLPMKRSNSLPKIITLFALAPWMQPLSARADMSGCGHCREKPGPDHDTGDGRNEDSGSANAAAVGGMSLLIGGSLVYGLRRRD
jgi:hypothetical protein